MTIEVTAKKVEDAIKQGLSQLGAELDQVNVEVVESGGLFRKAKVRLTLEEKQENTVRTEKADRPAKPAKPEKTEKPVKPVAAEKSTQNNTETSVKKSPVKNNGAEKAEKKEPKPKPDGAEKTQKKDAAPAGKENDESRRAALEQAMTFVKDVVNKMGFDGVTAALNGDIIELTAPAGDDSLLIGRHGETLSALSFLAETLGRAEKHHVNITVDCNGYRERRADSLTAMARRRANECVQKRRKIKLEAMERIDRRTIHNALTGDDRVSTASEGKEPYRYVVIYPKKKEQTSEE